MDHKEAMKCFESWCIYNGFTRTKRNGKYNIKITRLLYAAYVAGFSMGEYLTNPDKSPNFKPVFCFKDVLNIIWFIEFFKTNVKRELEATNAAE